jgi:hypothetical protein
VVLRQYGLKNTSRAVRALQDLDVHGIVVKDGDSYRFDDPFYRAWVISTTLRDVGALTLPTDKSGGSTALPVPNSATHSTHVTTLMVLTTISTSCARRQLRT